MLKQPCGRTITRGKGKSACLRAYRLRSTPEWKIENFIFYDGRQRESIMKRRAFPPFSLVFRSNPRPRFRCAGVLCVGVPGIVDGALLSYHAKASRSQVRAEHCCLRSIDPCRPAVGGGIHCRSHGGGECAAKSREGWWMGEARGLGCMAGAVCCRRYCCRLIG